MRAIVCGRWNRHSSSRPEAKNLWSTRNKLDKTTKSHEELKKSVELQKAENELTQSLLRELEEAGVDFIGDGGFRWDSIYDIARNIRGCGLFKQLARIPEANHFHRQPVAQLLLEHEPILLEDLRFSKSHTRLPLVPSLPGPYTLARQTENVSEFGVKRLSTMYARVLNQEIKVLFENGAAIVRIEEPQILSHPEDRDFFFGLMRELLWDIDSSHVALATWYGDIDRMLPEYFQLPFGTFFVDLVEGDRLVLQGFPEDKNLVAGIFDARQTYNEQEQDLLAIMGNILKYVDRSRVMISTNTDLHFLPWDESLEKVRRIVAFAKICETEKAFSSTPFLSSAMSLKQAQGNQPPLRNIEMVPKRPFRVPFPTSAVGSYPQNQEIRTARVNLRKGAISEAQYRCIVEVHAKSWMDFQIKELNMTCPVGGEFLREDMAAYFGERIGGRKLDFVPSYENRRYRPIEYDQPIHPAEHTMTTDDFRFLQSLSDRPVKETITGPVTMADWGLIKYPGYYFDRMAYRMGFVAAIRAEIEQMIVAGVTILQIDEPALTTKMKDFALDARALQEVMRGFENEVYAILHICYSDIRALDQAFPTIVQLPFHQIHMEVANRGDAMFGLIEKYGFAGKDIGLGVIDVHTDRVETVDEIIASVRKVRKYFEPEKIWITPDCGLKERSEEVAKAKLTAMTNAAILCREKLI